MHTIHPHMANGHWQSPLNVVFTAKNLMDSVEGIREEMVLHPSPRGPLAEIFGHDNTNILLRRRMALREDLDRVPVAFLSYENPWGSSGGVLAVARMAPLALQKKKRDVIRISPHHSKLADALDLSGKATVAECEVPIKNQLVKLKVYQVQDKKAEYGAWFLMSAPGYFELDGGPTKREPYFDSIESAEERDGAQSRLLRDSLFASKAVPYVLSALGHNKVVIDAQDWQFAPVARFALEAQLSRDNGSPVLSNAIVAVTLHNPYDHCLPAHILAQFTDYPLGDGETVLQRMIPITAAPVATVSRGFAEELRHSPLQTLHFAGHLQLSFRERGLIGITNGSLAPKGSPFSQEAITNASNGDFRLLASEKQQQRSEALRCLGIHQNLSSRASIGSLAGGNLSYCGGDITTLDSSVPLIVCYGRFDLGQKGVDIFVEAVRKMPRNVARYALISWPGSDDAYVHAHFEDYERLATERKGEFIFFTERYGDFSQLMKGATYTVYPSIYEPFGAMPDALTNGTPVVWRATGGLAHQLLLPSQKLYIPPGSTNQSLNYQEPWGSCVGYHEAIPTGINLRDEIVSLQSLTCPKERRSHPLFQSAAEALQMAMVEGCLKYAGDGHRYWRGLAELSDIPQDWEKNAEQKIAWYERATQA